LRLELSMADVVLRFIAGKQPGREVPVKLDQELIIGRAEEADLRIDEDTVSRKHATLTVKNGEITLQDCSKNGTYVNGRPVLQASLKPGDQVHIGHVILKLQINDAPPQLSWVIGEKRASHHETAALPLAGRTVVTAPAPVFAAPKPAGRIPSAGTSIIEHFRGSIADIAPTDLLQLFATTRKTGSLVLRSRDMIGRIHFAGGQVIHASMDDADTVNALKMLYRLLRWTDGTFEFEPPDEHPTPHTIDESTDHVLLEAMHQLDELNNLGPQLPSLHAELAIANPLPAPMRDLAPGDLDFIQLALRHKTVHGILDHYAGTDFEGYVHLKGLLARRYLIVAES
jgi:hypothetical protein